MFSLMVKLGKKDRGEIMRKIHYLTICPSGIRSVTKSRPNLRHNELCCRVVVDVPDILFQRPQLEATLTVKDIPKKEIDVDIILNTKELIEQQTGAKIDFKVIHAEEDEKQ